MKQEISRVYYKYRSLSSLTFALDILVNRRMYASEFTSLNDPMEGVFTYGNGKLSKWMQEAISNHMNATRILSLCESPDNLLMWSHYADGHRGMVIGIEMPNTELAVSAVKYVDEFSLDIDQDDVAQTVLIRKHLAWQYEREHRVFVKDGSFVQVDIVELIFGIETDREVAKLLTTVATAFSPAVSTRYITRAALNPGNGPYQQG